ncbi:hypothetical protein HAX54_010184 [Datura stramonium]|uniref:RING-type domain-containing protein n=1 Tax=Datura stramonium TaxID=4076 RepID=A0ABS8TFZ5_DATST|nr:hypothetical protein [Datura stramonium]
MHSQFWGGSYPLVNRRRHWGGHLSDLRRWKVLKNWYTSDFHCKKIFNYLNYELANNSRNCLVMVIDRPTLELTAKVMLHNEYVRMGNNSNVGGGNCLLCQKEVVDDFKFTNMSCSHMFHIDCIKVWLEKNNGCPVCAANVNDLDYSISDMEL